MGMMYLLNLKFYPHYALTHLENNNIHVEGIKEIDKEDINNANKLGYKIKLLGFSELINRSIFTEGFILR